VYEDTALTWGNPRWTESQVSRTLETLYRRNSTRLQNEMFFHHILVADRKVYVTPALLDVVGAAQTYDGPPTELILSLSDMGEDPYKDPLDPNAAAVDENAMTQGEVDERHMFDIPFTAAHKARWHVKPQLDIMVPCYYDPIVDSVCDVFTAADAPSFEVGPRRTLTPPDP
jgi:hypothetical protein